ncbi:hypothetical protein, partial [Acidithiobacillus thiooxidans]|uniref:hypothetical protein n=1 Tax=Acidithiobacillus thiooxidans TaxID=930 RepID=UPI001C07BBAD
DKVRSVQADSASTQVLGVGQLSLRCSRSTIKCPQSANNTAFLLSCFANTRNIPTREWIHNPLQAWEPRNSRVAALPKARVPVEAGLVEAVPAAEAVAGVVEPHNNTRVVGVARKVLVGIRDNRP